MKFLSSASAVALLCLSGVAFAQPDTNNAPKAENPPNQQVGGRGGNRWNPAQMQQQRAARQAQQIKAMLTASGITSVPTQDAVVAFANEQQVARSAVQEKARKIAEALRNQALTEKQLAVLLADYQAAVEDEKARHTQASSKLDQKISYTKSPKLEAILTVLGLVGDAPFVLDTNMGGRDGFGGGPGNGFGRGGQGGFGQGNTPRPGDFGGPPRGAFGAGGNF